MVRAGLGLVAMLGVCVSAAHGVVITFEDPAFEQAVRDLVGIPTGDIEDTDVNGITDLNLSHIGVSDLTGIEYFTSLESLFIDGGNVTDLTPISGLTSLINLFLHFNPVTDFSPITGLTNLANVVIGDGSATIDLSFVPSLTSLNSFTVLAGNVSNLSALASSTTPQLQLSADNVSDVTPIGMMTGLTFLELTTPGLSDISPLMNLTSLNAFGIYRTDVTDVSVITNFTVLETFQVFEGLVSDISPAASLPTLKRIAIVDCPISSIGVASSLPNLEELEIALTDVTDLTPLTNHPALKMFHAFSSNLTDISPLANVVTLEDVNIVSNNVVDISALSGLTNLTLLDIRFNNIADLTPLVDNVGIGTGDAVIVNNNPLSQGSLCFSIPIMEARGATVQFDGICDEQPLPCPLWPAMDAQGRDAYDAISLNWNFDDPAGDGVPDRWQVRLVAFVLCRPNHPLHAVTDAAYQTNRELLLSEPSPFPVPLSTLFQTKELLSALLLVSQASQDTTTGFLGLDHDYIVVDGFAKAPDEPFAGDGDLDGDGFTNQQEYDNIIANGGTLENYLAAASNPELSGAETFPAASPVGMAIAITLITLAAFAVLRRPGA